MEFTNRKEREREREREQGKSGVSWEARGRGF